MFYFNSLPIIDYNSDKMRDIFKRIVITNELTNDWFDIYRMNDEQTLHDVSFELYGTISYWWMLCLINNIKDYHYDAIIQNDVLQKLAQDLQVLELTSLKDYILVPINTNISATVSGNSIRGEILDKYILNDKYYIDVRLDDITQKFPDSITVNIDTEKIAKVTVSRSSLYNVGDLVRQDFTTIGGSIEGFCRGYIVQKEFNDLYIFKTKITDFYPTGTTLTINDKETVTSRLVLVGKKLPSNVYADVISHLNVTQFDIENSEEYRLNYLDRYDKLEEINNNASVIRVIKKQYLNNLQNAVLEQLG